VAIDTYGTDVQLRMIASGHGLGLVQRTALEASPLRVEVAVLDVTDFSLSLDVWLVHRRQPGNLRKAPENVASSVAARIEGAADLTWHHGRVTKAHIAAAMRVREGSRAVAARSCSAGRGPSAASSYPRSGQPLHH